MNEVKRMNGPIIQFIRAVIIVFMRPIENYIISTKRLVMA